MERTVLVVGHTAQISGAEVVTMELLREEPRRFRYLWACPEGPLAGQVRRLGARHVPVTGTAGSLRLHPAHTPRAVAQLLRTGLETYRIARQGGVDLIHAVSMRAGIAAAISRRLGGPPFVVWQHDVLPVGRVTRALRALVDPACSMLIAVSPHVESNLRELGFRTDMRVVFPPVRMEQFDPDRVSRDGLRQDLAPEGGPVFGVIGQISPWKGHDTAIRALGELRRTVPDARLVIAGGITFDEPATRFDNAAYLDELHALVAELGLQDAVTFAGQRKDVPELLASLDALLLPSWDEPFGTIVWEAMAMRVPVVVSSVGGPGDEVTDGQDGLVAPPHDPPAWAAAMARILQDPKAANRMGCAARATAERYSHPEVSLAALADAHLAVLSSS
ncbi:MAG TPA: glycosyltransferase family 4 protein [Thermoleophilaceae bacterium]|jgi:glycosyltransferase involved in cell wall biosynthesis